MLLLRAMPSTAYGTHGSSRWCNNFGSYLGYERRGGRVGSGTAFDPTETFPIDYCALRGLIRTPSSTRTAGRCAWRAPKGMTVCAVDPCARRRRSHRELFRPKAAVVSVAEKSGR